jgi:RNA polymerase sigma factor (sigma-70 family)
VLDSILPGGAVAAPESSVLLEDVRRWLPAVRAGTADAETRLLSALRPPLHRFFRARFAVGTDPEAAAEDLTQETLWRIHRHLGSVRGVEAAAFLGWCFMIARRVGLDAVRAARREAHTIALDAETLLVSEHGDATETTPENPRAIRLAKSQALLSPADQELLWRRIVRNESWLEVGGALRISWTAARRRYQRAQRLLRDVATRADESDATSAM